MASNKPLSSGSYPEGSAYHAFVRRRKRAGKLWHMLFLAATLIGIIALTTLLVTIVNDAFGYIAIQRQITPEDLIVKHYKQKMLDAPQTLTSEDDEKLADGIAARPGAIGFFGYSFYQDNADELKLVSVDGVQPTESTVETGSYLLSRPLYVYSTQSILQAKPEVAAFVYYYLTNANSAAQQVGYFPLGDQSLNASLASWQSATGLTPSTVQDLYPAAGDIQVVGSSTMAPITQQMAKGFQAAGGYTGSITVESTGTDAGIQAFCQDRQGDLLDASRPLIGLNVSACQRRGRQPLQFKVANDGVPIVVSSQNDFLTNVTVEQLRQIFTTAEKWSDVDLRWPDKPILHFIPGAESGTLDFFVAEVFGNQLEIQPPAVLAELLAANVSAGRLRALEKQNPLAERDPAELIQLIEREVVKPQVAGSWSLFESIFNRKEIEAQVAEMPGAELKFYSWVNKNFITSPQSSDPLQAGIWIAILGSLWVTLIAFLVAVPLGVAAAIYLEEYSSGKSRFDHLIETNINNLAGVPSIIYGMLGLAVFVRFLAPLTSGEIFGAGNAATTNGRTILSAGLTLGVLILPLVIINSREAIRAVPRAIREASYGLGATRWQTTWNHVLPNAISGILTGVILSVSRAFGETAPLIVVGVSTFIVVAPDGPFSKYTTLPAQIFQWTSRPQEEFQHLAAAAILVLLVLLIALNATAIYLRNRYSKKPY